LEPFTDGDFGLGADMTDKQTKSKEIQGPRFVHYFGPLLDALRELGGEASPEQVAAWIRQRLSIPQAELDETTKGGQQSRYENKVGWARFYLAKAGLIDGSRRGHWVLTPEGQMTTLDHASALAVFKDVQSRFQQPSDDEDELPPASALAHELFDDPSRQFWFVGATWDNKDQTQRFVDENIWQNGYDEKFADQVKEMRPGDRIAIKASFTQRYNLPFENRGQVVSAMRIKAIGVVIGNEGDGKTVKVKWEKLDPPRDWFFYTFRVTVVGANPSDDLARRLILFTFADAKQDYEFWITKVPYFAKKFADEGRGDLTQFYADSSDLDLQTDAPPSYGVEEILAEGCFLSREEIEGFLDRLRSKCNLILQGPPGTGKTWLARRLAYALLGTKDRRIAKDQLRIVQFHPSLTYEDFVRGWRPSGNGQLQLTDGIFLETVQAALAEPDLPFVLIIEEINRGNPAQCFGEMLTLLEATKRRPDEAIELAYRREEGEQVFIPRNLFVIGTMNVADRSLALVDVALRRRFAFAGLRPQFNDAWSAWCARVGQLDSNLLVRIREAMAALNQDIASDRALGEQYSIGHSYFTPAQAISNGQDWCAAIVHTEIAPLLDEYWFDQPDRAATASKTLLERLAA